MKFVTRKQIEYYNKENEFGEPFCKIYIDGNFEFSFWGHVEEDSDLKEALEEEGYVFKT